MANAKNNYSSADNTGKIKKINFTQYFDTYFKPEVKIAKRGYLVVLSLHS